MWRDGRGLAIDVAVINPLLHMGVDNPCEEYATAHKHRKYDSGFVGSRYFFAPVVFETSGGVNGEGEEVIKQILRFASSRSGSRHCVFAGRAWARIACCIQDSVAQSILNRCPNSGDVDDVQDMIDDVCVPPCEER